MKIQLFFFVTLNSPDSRYSQNGLYEQVKPDAGSKIVVLLRIPCSNNVRGSSTLKLMSVRKRVGKVPWIREYVHIAHVSFSSLNSVQESSPLRRMSVRNACALNSVQKSSTLRRMSVRNACALNSVQESSTLRLMSVSKWVSSFTWIRTNCNSRQLMREDITKVSHTGHYKGQSNRSINKPGTNR